MIQNINVWVVPWWCKPKLLKCLSLFFQSLNFEDSEISECRRWHISVFRTEQTGVCGRTRPSAASSLMFDWDFLVLWENPCFICLFVPDSCINPSVQIYFWKDLYKVSYGLKTTDVCLVNKWWTSRLLYLNSVQKSLLWWFLIVASVWLQFQVFWSRKNKLSLKKIQFHPEVSSYYWCLWCRVYNKWQLIFCWQYYC